MTQPPAGGSGAAWRRPALLLLLVALVAALAVLGTRSWSAREDAPPAAGSYGPASDRDDVMAATRKFVVAVNTYGPDDLDSNGHLTAWKKRVDALLTTKNRTAFDKTVEFPEQMVAQTSFSRTAKVYGLGVAMVNADHATVLAAVEVTDRYGKDAPAPGLRRWQVGLVKVKGAWLVDEYEAVGGQTP